MLSLIKPRLFNGQLIKATRLLSTQADTLLVKDVDSVRYIRLNNPKTKNSMTAYVIEKAGEAVKEANESKQIGAVVYSGTGDFFCSGNDQSNFTWIGKQGAEALEEATVLANVIKDYVDAFIDCQKPIIVAANGPGIGGGCTVLGLADYAVAADHSYFWAPFSRLALSPELCSSFTFPQIIGPSRTTQLFYFNQRVTAQQALEWGLVAKLLPGKDKFEAALNELIHDSKSGLLAGTSFESMKATKSLVHNRERREHMHRVNAIESRLLAQRLASPEAIKVAETFLKASKSKR